MNTTNNNHNNNYDYTSPSNPYETDPTTNNLPFYQPDNVYQAYNIETLLRKAEYEYSDEKKDAIVMWLLWLFLSPLGAHRYYLGHTLYAIFMTVTLGGFGIWAIIDAFFITQALQKVNKEKRKEVFGKYGVADYV